MPKTPARVQKTIKGSKPTVEKSMFLVKTINEYAKKGMMLIRKLSSVQVLVVLLVFASFLIGVLVTKAYYLEKELKANTALGANAQAAEGTPAPAQKVKVSVGNFPPLGKKNAKVTIVEFADFRCPFCEQFFSQTQSQMIKDYVDTGKARFYFRNAFGVPGDPAPSTAAANAVECANDQGKFWDYFTYLFKNQPDESDTSMYNTDTLTQAAISLGLDGNKFRDCLSQQTDNANVQKDIADGQAVGVSGTPTFFINGTMLLGAQPYPAFKTLIDQELKNAK